MFIGQRKAEKSVSAVPMQIHAARTVVLPAAATAHLVKDAIKIKTLS